jgi:hypothetical protein
MTKKPIVIVIHNSFYIHDICSFICLAMYLNSNAALAKVHRIDRIDLETAKI